MVHVVSENVINIYLAKNRSSMFSLHIFISCFLFTSTSQENEEVNERPVIGVAVMKITDEKLIQTYPALVGKHYVPASYVKLIEMTGARLVPISPKMATDTVEYIFNSVNGLLFAGEGDDLNDSGYYNLTKKLFEFSIIDNKNGAVVPLLGIGSGFQALVLHVEGNKSPFIVTDSYDYSTTVNWNVNEMKNHSFLSSMPKEMIRDCEKQPITAHFHKYSVASQCFKRSAKLNRFFKVLGTSSDRNGKEFVSAIEGKKFPFYGIQFHPEKTMFEWSTAISIPHSPQAVQLSQFIANSFMEQVRRNKRHFSNSFSEGEYLIEKYHVLRTNNTDSHPFRVI
ncbi:gamma-glutamyl hydrolase-like [Hydractinia symbiolongicarpus]|uniref:gamma-glutamyl hydrolase-like n=1 Tax=Hydractinia symbiolongicarpus TaxID=13093 RepID=UPI00254B6B82|nr:gamma-glutamyl hydrolase-like [Hydractinia symbiolongicarpus]